MKPCVIFLGTIWLIALVAVAGYVYVQQDAPSSGTMQFAPPQEVPEPPVNTGGVPAIPSPQPSTIPPTISPAPSAAPAAPPADMSDYFINIAYGLGWTRLQKWDEPTVKVGITGDFDDTDISVLEAFAQEFNGYSLTKIRIQPGLDLQPVELVLAPESVVRSMDLDGYQGGCQNENGSHVYYRFNYPPHSLYLQKRYYISDDIPASRNFSLQSALLHGMGFVGDSDDPRSFFSQYNYVSTILTENDNMTIIIMYSTGISSDDTIDEVKQYIH
jgi:hypothetical protein